MTFSHVTVSSAVIRIWFDIRFAHILRQKLELPTIQRRLFGCYIVIFPMVKHILSLLYNMQVFSSIKPLIEQVSYTCIVFTYPHDLPAKLTLT